jgi:hypothetical protein
MLSGEHERQFSGMVCGEVRSAVEVRREGHVGEHAEQKAGMRGVDRTVSVSLHGRAYVAQSLEHVGRAGSEVHRAHRRTVTG